MVLIDDDYDDNDDDDRDSETVTMVDIIILGVAILLHNASAHNSGSHHHHHHHRRRFRRRCCYVFYLPLRNKTISLSESEENYDLISLKNQLVGKMIMMMMSNVRFTPTKVEHDLLFITVICNWMMDDESRLRVIPAAPTRPPTKCTSAC